ncbi:MAG: hypothetical protein AAFV53_11385 [Myxococcota bacterium]
MSSPELIPVLERLAVALEAQKTADPFALLRVAEAARLLPHGLRGNAREIFLEEGILRVVEGVECVMRGDLARLGVKTEGPPAVDDQHPGGLLPMPESL